MDNKQAAAVLREQIREYRDNGYLNEYQNAHERSVHDRLMECVKRGADAMEMLEWLFEQGPWGRFCWRVMYDEWNGEGTFRAFCEARFEESKKHA